MIHQNIPDDNGCDAEEVGAALLKDLRSVIDEGLPHQAVPACCTETKTGKRLLSTTSRSSLPNSFIAYGGPVRCRR
jgi:hypothetical protein